MNSTYQTNPDTVRTLRRSLRWFSALVAIALWAGVATAAPDPGNWPAVENEARGQRVYWHAWGGDVRINDYISWIAGQVRARYGVELRHVKLADTADAVSRVVGEKAAGRSAGGAVDLIWINGENFSVMKQNGLLFGPWATELPNWQFVDVENNPTLLRDFTIATDGYEAPWTNAQLIFYHDSRRVPEPPLTIPALLAWARANPGRFAYPQPPDFLGTTFLKQALYELLDDPAVLGDPAHLADFAALTRPLWAYLDQLTPLLWRSGKAWPGNGARLRQMMADAEIDLALSLNPAEVTAAVANFELPATVRAFGLADSTIGNSSFVAIPYNASAIAGALVVANFLLSPQAQARAQDRLVWGSPTILDVARLPATERGLFDGAGAPVIDLGPVLPEPHPLWTERLEAEWQQRYGASR